MDKKPKCYLCGEVGNECYYIWLEGRGGGKLVHASCIIKVDKLIKKNSKNDT